MYKERLRRWLSQNERRRGRYNGAEGKTRVSSPVEWLDRDARRIARFMNPAFVP